MEAKVSDHEDDFTPWEESIPLGEEAAFLNPEAPLATPVMPDAIWASLERALFNEQIAREGASNVVSLDTHRRSKRNWVLGTAAAGISLLAVGVVVQSVQSSSPALIASGNQIPSNAQGAFPVKQVLASGTDYQPATLTSQVKELVHGLPGVQKLMKAAPAQTMPVMPIVGEMTTSVGMAHCVHALTKDSKVGALVVDVATFHGSAASIVVIPLTFQASAPTAPAILHVWVVGPHCSPVHPDVLGEFTIALATSGSASE